jgi:hypothetical protein
MNPSARLPQVAGRDDEQRTSRSETIKMKSGRLRFPFSLALVAFLGCATSGALVIDNAAPRAAVAQDIDEAYFYANLAPHGQWFFQADFGWVWHPARVGAGWRPYTEGQWVWAGDAGWTWASQEPWGWATYHYGRWYFDPMFGWSWVPGRTWAPAWVSWRIESGYIGWAPLWPAYFDQHPEYRWESWRKDHDWDRRHQGRDWDRWVFTRDRDFTSDRVGRHAITDRKQRDGIYSRSRDVTRYDEENPERIGHSIDRAIVEKATGRPVRTVTLETADRPGDKDDTAGDRVRMFRPRVKETPADKTPDRLGLAKTPESREVRERDTLRSEKQRLNGTTEKNAAAEKAETAADGSQPKRSPSEAQRPAREQPENAKPERSQKERQDRNKDEGAERAPKQPDGGRPDQQQGGNDREPVAKPKQQDKQAQQPVARPQQPSEKAQKQNERPQQPGGKSRQPDAEPQQQSEKAQKQSEKQQQRPAPKEGDRGEPKGQPDSKQSPQESPGGNGKPESGPPDSQGNKR